MRRGSAHAADTSRGERKGGERDGTEDPCLGAEVGALEGEEQDSEDLLTLSLSELLEHTGEQGWDEIFAAVREKQISQGGEANPTAVGFPLPGSKRSLADWLELAPADMYKGCAGSGTQVWGLSLHVAWRTNYGSDTHTHSPSTLT